MIKDPDKSDLMERVDFSSQFQRDTVHHGGEDVAAGRGSMGTGARGCTVTFYPRREQRSKNASTHACVLVQQAGGAAPGEGLLAELESGPEQKYPVSTSFNQDPLSPEPAPATPTRLIQLGLVARTPLITGLGK